MNDEMKKLIFEVCNDWVANGLTCTRAIYGCFIASTGDRDKYPHPLDALAKLAMSEASVAQTAPSALDARFRSQVADLLHLLRFAQIACPTAGDSEQAEVVMADIRRMLEQEAKP